MIVKTFPIINASVLVQIREQWQMSRAEMAELLQVPTRTYEGWEYGRPIPKQAQAHIRSIGNLRLIYQHWDNVAQAIVSAGGAALTKTSLVAAVSQADRLADDHEKLWSELFPLLKRE